MEEVKITEDMKLLIGTMYLLSPLNREEMECLVKTAIGMIQNGKRSKLAMKYGNKILK